MKPNTKQFDLMIDISAEIGGWTNISDITSPSHWDMIEKFVKHELSAGDLPEQDRKDLIEGLSIIMQVIKRTE